MPSAIMELATRAYPSCGSPIVFARLIESALSARLGFICLPCYHFWSSISPMPLAPLDVRGLSLIARQTLSTRMFHVKHSGHFSFLFEPIIFLTTYSDSYRGKLFHVKHNEKSAANGVRLNFLCRRFTLTKPRPLLVSTFVVLYCPPSVNKKVQGNDMP